MTNDANATKMTICIYESQPHVESVESMQTSLLRRLCRLAVVSLPALCVSYMMLLCLGAQLDI